MGVFIGALLACLLSAAVTWMVLRSATRLRIIDHPDEERRLHRVATPRSGGLGIALVLLLVVLVSPPEASPQGWLLPVAVLAIAGVGMLDDLRALRALPKLVGQLLGVSLVALSMPWPAPEPWVGIVIAAVVVLAFVNVWNFMDGSDGMAAVQALLLSLCLAALGSGVWAWALVGACVGFLPFNVPKARIFLGDVGSHALGLGLAILMLSALGESRVALPSVLLLVSAFLLDSGWTLLLRLVRREPFWKAHSKHLYQRLIRSGLSHASVCIIYACWTSAAVAACWASQDLTSTLQWALVMLFYGSGSILYFMMIGRRPPAPGAGSPE
ncbi:MAG TPA: lipopolysaccharide biosynthesis protein [Arenimonas sp.]|nr:lipopolysaccharide biosynthesis protein [Arenimonas sp.]